MLTIPDRFPDGVVPRNTEQENPMVESMETDLQGGSYHFSEHVMDVQLVCLCKGLHETHHFKQICWRLRVIADLH